MINHARTLLLNRKPDNVPYGGQLGDEYLPIAYRKVTTMPTYLSSIRNILFSADPDRLFSNYRARQYMTLLHSTELVEFVLELDPRITYDRNNEDLFADALYEITPPEDDIYVNGKLGAPDKLGRSFHQWSVKVSSGSTVTVTRETPTKQVSVQEYTMTDGLSSSVKLVGSEASIRFRQTIGKTWVLSGYARPEKDLGVIEAELGSTGAVFLNDLFGVGTEVGGAEPFTTFRNLWFGHTELSYRVGGILLAVIYRMRDLKSG